MRRTFGGLIAASSILLIPAAAIAAQATTQAPPAQPTLQQQFEAASVALQAEHWEQALALYQALEARLSASHVRDLGIVRVRKASALAGLGREEEAGEALRLGLPALPASDPSLADDRFSGLVTLAKIAERALDYGEAYKDYLAAEQLVPDFQSKAPALRGLIQTGMFYDAPAALARADAAVVAAAALKPAQKNVEGLFRTMRGRVLLNMGRPAEALKELQTAVSLLGGLTEKVDAADLSARSDVAIAALQSGDQDKAREYLAWTGAGHFKQGFPLGSGMVPPPCGTDLSPSDVAIVEFSVRDDGTVGYAAPIYSSRQGPSALLFAEAVTGWSWKPDELKDIPPLFRALTRMEVRCSNASAHPSVVAALRGDVDQWLEARGAAPTGASERRSDAARLKPLEAELARREKESGASSLALLPVLADLASNDLVSREDTHAYLARGLAIARAEKAPPPVLAWFGIGLANADWKWPARDKLAAALRMLLADPPIAGDPRASAAVRLALAESLYYGKKGSAEAIATLLEVPKTPGLDPHDPFRAAALARAASLQLIAGDVPAAKAAYVQSGLNATQCSLLDAPPRMKFNGASDSDFPMAALRWGFEGWVKLEFDLTANGKTTNVRPVIAYPPFVFEKSATTIIDKTLYEKTFRPDGDLGCGGISQHIRFVIPVG
jgi:tetratricopeptide (TPR) repeat protein